MLSYYQVVNVFTCGLVDRVLDSKSKGMGFNSHCQSRSHVQVLYKLLIPCCICLPNNDGYLMDENCACVLSGSSFQCTICLCGAMRSASEWTFPMHCVACSRPTCVIVGRHIGSGAARWLPWEPSNIPRQILEMVIKRNFSLLYFTNTPDMANTSLE